MATLAGRFWPKVNQSGGGPDACWLWTGATNNRGYGRIWVAGRHVLAHRLSWELHHGPVPAGLNVLHNCPGGDNPACVNPAHLWVDTQAANVEDKMAKGRHRSLRGEQHPKAKLTETQVLEVRRCATAGESQGPVASRFGVGKSTVRHILTGRRWAWLKESA